MTLAAGRSIAHYTILGPLGAGAMGEVYRARDTKLGREVAVKVLPDEFAGDEERLKRFEREAVTLASLNHPNVAQIFGVDQVDDTCFLVLELVPGESLEERLRRGALPLEEALDVCKEIAEGLEAAHEAGVIHRDLKPANVRITPEGKVKVLDFGLAKPMRLSGETRSTDSVLATEQGRLLGTPIYMAPEQARGKSIDRRVDVWAFGCVLYECLTGKRAFDGETISDVLGSVLRSEADFALLPSATPARVRELLRRCLHKDPHRRLRDIGDARLMLEEIEQVAELPVERPARRSVLPWAIAALASAALGAVLWRGSGGDRMAVREVVRLAVRVPYDAELNVETNLDEQQVLALSPDGSMLAFVARDGDGDYLYLRRLDRSSAERLEGTDGAGSPFFSPDGRWIGYFARGKLRKAPVAGGSSIELCEVGLNRGGAWCLDGTIVFSPSTSDGLLRIPGNGGTPVELTRLDPAKKERTHRWPTLLPGGEEVAFTVGTTDKPGNYEDSRIDAVALASGARRELLRGASMVKAFPSGELVLAREGQLLSLPIRDATGGAPEAAVSVLQGVSGIASSGVAYFDLAANGTLAYAERHPKAGEFELAWITRDGRAEPLPFPPRHYLAPRISPDGKRIAVGIGPALGRDSDVWIGDLALGSLQRLTFDDKSAMPIWTRDGKRVTFGMFSGSGTNLGWKAADGSDATEILASSMEVVVPRSPLSWSADGRTLLFQQDGGPGRSSDLWSWSSGSTEVHEVAASAAVEFAASLSPDGAWLAYSSDESGSGEVYVQAFPGPGGRWQVSEGGACPKWSADGKELFYLDGRTLYVVPVQYTPTFALGTPQRLFEQVFRVESETIANYDVAPDGRFLVVRDTAEESMAHHVNVVLNWSEELRRATERE